MRVILGRGCGDHDRAAGTLRRTRHRLAEPAGPEDSTALALIFIKFFPPIRGRAAS